MTASHILDNLDRAGLLARIAELQKALDEALADIEGLHQDLALARHDLAYGGAE